MKALTTEVVANCDHLKRLKFSPNLPNAFTEHGAIMLATVLNSPLARKLIDLEKKYDRQFRSVFDAIRQLMAPSVAPRPKIGFRGGKEDK